MMESLESPTIRPTTTAVGNSPTKTFPILENQTQFHLYAHKQTIWVLAETSLRPIGFGCRMGGWVEFASLLSSYVASRLAGLVWAKKWVVEFPLQYIDFWCAVLKIRF